MSVFFTDTDCELWHTYVKKYNINLIKMPYNLDDQEGFYDMGETDDYKHFYRRMREGAVPTTQALNPQLYVDYFEPHLKNGDDILYVHFSDQMSGTFNYMKTAIDELMQKYPQRKITTFNTKNICMGGGFQALEAAKLHAEGKSDEEIVEFLEEFSKHINTTFVVENLTYLKRGGRLSGASAFFGKLLNIKPILKVTSEGKIEKSKTANGFKTALTLMVSDLAQNIDKQEKFPLYVLDADNEKMIEFVKTLIAEKLPNARIECYPIGPVICAHCGPGTVGFVYYGKKQI